MVSAVSRCSRRAARRARLDAATFVADGRGASRDARDFGFALVVDRSPGGVDDLSAARALLDDLAEERDRLVDERFTLQQGGWLLPGFGFDDRAASVDTLLQEIEDFVAVDFARIERKAEADDAMAARLLTATKKILAMLRGTSITEDVIDDVVAGVKETKADLLTGLETWLQRAAVVAGGLVGAVAGLAIGSAVAGVVSPLSPVTRIGAGALGAVLGGVAGVSGGRAAGSAIDL